jgi:phage recombination protein Bet
MSTALMVSPDQNQWTPTQIAALRQIGLSDAPAGDLALFLHYAQKTGLDPFSRQIYMIGRWSKDGTRYTIQSSIDGLRIIAQRSGEYAGQTAPMWCGADGVWTDVWLKNEPPIAAKVGVYRAGFTEALVAVARLESYRPLTKDGKPMGLWNTMPDVMLAKVAESLALRKAFPNDLSGIYTSEEMEQADAKPVPQAVQAPQKAQAPVLTLLTDDERLEVCRAIQSANSKDALRKIWTVNADHLDTEWLNGFDELVSLKSLILARQSEVN